MKVSTQPVLYVCRLCTGQLYSDSDRENAMMKPLDSTCITGIEMFRSRGRVWDVCLRDFRSAFASQVVQAADFALDVEAVVLQHFQRGLRLEVLAGGEGGYSLPAVADDELIALRPDGERLGIKVYDPHADRDAARRLAAAQIK